MTVILLRAAPHERCAAKPRTGAIRPLSAWTAWLRELRRRRRSRGNLARLDDRMLKDIGVTRADVEREMNKPFWLP